jgi:hypothetical protein
MIFFYFSKNYNTIINLTELNRVYALITLSEISVITCFHMVSRTLILTFLKN